MIEDDRRVAVCEECLAASCWYGEFMCEKAMNAGLIVKTVGELRWLSREHQDNWTRKKFYRIYGTEHPDFGEPGTRDFT